MTRFTLTTIATFAFCFASFGEATPESAPADVVAKNYLTAFFHSDLSTAASLLHSETLTKIKDAFILEFEKAKASNNEQKFRSQYGLKSEDDLHELPAKSIYILVTSNARNTRSIALMKNSAISVSSSEAVNENQAKVNLIISLPADFGTAPQSTSLLLEKENGYWKVLGNS
jgi:hypothetical protein